MEQTVYSICGMCAVRCPIRIEVQDGEVKWIEGNPNDPRMGRSLCAKGAAGIPFEYDYERPLAPMIRTGPRGCGQWREVSWDEALDFVAGKLKAIMAKHGGRAVALSDRGGPFNDLTRSFMKAIGSPNYFDHDCTCGRNAHHACKSLFGYGRMGMGYDIENTKHIVLYGRNMIESMKVKEVKALMGALEKGAKLTYIDPRASLTAGKATRYWMIRPGTDYALNLTIAHIIIREKLYDKGFVKKWVRNFKALADFVKPYTPDWATKETGIQSEEIVVFCREIAADAPHVILHGGWMVSRYPDSFYASRMAYIINVLLGSIEAEGGLFIAKGPAELGRKGLNSLGTRIPEVEEKRCDGVGWKFTHFDTVPGLLQLLFPCLESGDPYPIKAYIVYRLDPLTAMPDPEAQKAAYEKLDLLVSVDVNYSESAWYSDVILPEATYLERENILMTVKGLVPAFARRQRAIEPRYDSRPGWWIFCELARRVGKGEYLPFQSVEEIWDHQLESTGVRIGDFDAKGFVALTKAPTWWGREDGLRFKTPSGKVEFVSSALEEAGISSLKPYERPTAPPQGWYRLLFGRCGYQAHGQTANNPVLSEFLGENDVWINIAEAEKLGIKDGGLVEVSSNGISGTIRARVTEWIHPEAVFMLHGFGRRVPALTRAYGKGLADQAFQMGLLRSYDPVGGGVNFLQCFVQVKPVNEERGGGP